MILVLAYSDITITQVPKFSACTGISAENFKSIVSGDAKKGALAEKWEHLLHVCTPSMLALLIEIQSIAFLK